MMSLNHDDMVQACKNIGFDLTCGACAELFFTGSSPHKHDTTCATEHHAKKWQDYERNYILPCFKWAEESGLDLRDAVTKNAGMNCVEILVKWLQAHERDARTFAGVIDAVREALGQKETHYLCVAGDVKELVEAIESRCDAVLVLKRLRGEGTRL
jgi:hypothetical protein